MNQKKLGKILKITLTILLILAIPIILVSPFLLNHTNKIIYSMVIIYPNGIIMLGIMYYFILLFKSLEQNNPFTQNNVKILKNTSLLSFGLSILWLLDLLFMIFVIKNTYINYIIVLIFLVFLFFGVGIALYILSELFYQATTYKEENDLTI